MRDAHFKDHFSKHSAGYAAYRPSYPSGLIDVLADLCPSQQRALDCGCGTGQLSVLLANRFTEVIATDASSAQIAKANKKDNVNYKTALAENSGLADASVDLVTVAQAAHWLDLAPFYKEVARIAKVNAILALITYGVVHVEGEVDRLVQQFYYQDINTYWPAERQHVENGYQDLPFPFAEIQTPTLEMRAYWDLEALIGYFNTWSAVKAATQALGVNPTEALKQSLLPIWGDPKTTKTITWPLSMRVGRVNVS